MNKLSSADKQYKSGSLSVFPKNKDNKINLHEARNNAEDFLQQTLAINGKFITLSDGDKFPESGIIKITPKDSDNLLDKFETIFYAKKIGDQLHLLQRGYGGTSPTTWPAGCKVSCPVMADHHNAIKDAIINIQKKVGPKLNPGKDTVNGVLTYLESKWLSPKPVFKAYPKIGIAPLSVTFHNFSMGYSGKYLWDFGDGSTSTEANPIHAYLEEGTYTVRLTTVAEDGSQGLTEKPDYIQINNELVDAFFHVTPLSGDANTEFDFTDQSEGNIIERHWYFGDGVDQTISNPNIHSTSHIYKKSGTYSPILILRMSDNKTKRVILPEGIIVS